MNSKPRDGYLKLSLLLLAVVQTGLLAYIAVRISPVEAPTISQPLDVNVVGGEVSVDDSFPLDVAIQGEVEIDDHTPLSVSVQSGEVHVSGEVAIDGRGRDRRYGAGSGIRPENPLSQAGGVAPFSRYCS